MAMVTRRRVLQAAAVAAGGLTLPLVRTAGVAGLAPTVVPKGKMTLAWHTNIASRWLDPQQHDGTATPDNFLFANQDALIKNFRDKRYDHLALADKFEFAEDAKSATFQLRAGVKFHDASPITPEDVKWSYEHYRGASATLLQEKTQAIAIRAQIMNQLEELQERLGVSYLFIGHDLATVAHISHRIAVMYLGQIVELAESLELCNQPLHPYTQALFTAALPAHPDDKREKLTISGEVPSAIAPPPGCRFHPRCPQAMARCSVEAPARQEVAPRHSVACHLY